MQLPVKAHYATVAMLAIAAEYDEGKLVAAREIAAQHSVPSQFLVQILQQLRAAGLVQSIRGSSGGFRLNKPPSQTTLSEIVEAVCPTGACMISGDNVSAIQQTACQLWADMERREREFLLSITLSDLLDRACSAPGTMFYI